MWGFMKVFRKNIILQAVVILFDVNLLFDRVRILSLTHVYQQGNLRFLTPIGTNQLLKYLENGGAASNPVVRPWVWITMVAIGGSFFPAVTNHFYAYLTVSVYHRLLAVTRFTQDVHFI
jgi:hypothetical protein